MSDRCEHCGVYVDESEMASENAADALTGLALAIEEKAGHEGIEKDLGTLMWIIGKYLEAANEAGKHQRAKEREESK